MQTPAEKLLIQNLVLCLKANECDFFARRILNVGSGKSLSIERQLKQAGCNYICDRIDIEDCVVDFSTVRNCWHCSVDNMEPLDSERYHAVFANYVLEHVYNLKGAAQEIYRVLLPDGIFIATIPNTTAPEFIIARHTPLWFHKLVSRRQAWETKYSYNGISALIEIFLDAGFGIEEEKHWPFVEGYLWQYPVVNIFGRLYDRLVSAINMKHLMGQVCIVLRKRDWKSPSTGLSTLPGKQASAEISNRATPRCWSRSPHANFGGKS